MFQGDPDGRERGGLAPHGFSPVAKRVHVVGMDPVSGGQQGSGSTVHVHEVRLEPREVYDAKLITQQLKHLELALFGKEFLIKQSENVC